MDIIIILLAKMPLKALYFIANIFRVLNNNTLKYRISIIKKNIQLSFPLLEEKNINDLINKFYIFLFNLVVEIIKSINFKKEDFLERVYIDNNSIVHKNIKQNKSTLLICAHHNNWEWLILRLSLINDINLAAVYKPISNKYINSLLLKIRGKFGAILIPLKKWKYFILNNNNKPYVFMCVADQVPGKKVNGERISFLNQSTLFDKGPEKIAKKLNIDVIYSNIVKEKKGYYRVNFKKITSEYITHEYVKLLEKSIKETPQSWLWSHNRWKR